MEPAAPHDMVLVADDDAGFRTFLRQVLERAGWSVAEAADGEAALEQLTAPPALVLVDVRMPKMNGYEVCAQLRERFGDGLPIIFISGERTEALDRTAGLLVGADDYVVKPFDPAELLARIKSVLRSHGVRQPRGEAGNGGKLAALTPREREVLELLAEGLSTQEIAAHLVISPRTVGTHVQNILEKLGVRSRTQAVTLAMREGQLRPQAGGVAAPTG